MVEYRYNVSLTYMRVITRYIFLDYIVQFGYVICWLFCQKHSFLSIHTVPNISVFYIGINCKLAPCNPRFGELCILWRNCHIRNKGQSIAFSNNLIRSYSTIAILNWVWHINGIIDVIFHFICLCFKYLDEYRQHCIQYHQCYVLDWKQHFLFVM